MEAVPWLLVAQAGGALAFLLLAVVGASARIAQLVARLILLGLQASLLVQLQPVVMRRDSKDSGLWRLLFVAIALWMVAVAHELASLLLGGELPPVPALAHLMLVAGLIAATTGVSLYPVSEGQDIGRLRDLLDVVLLLIGSLSLFWMAVVRPVIDAGIGSPITIVWLALPAAFDLALGLLLFRLVLLGGARPERIMLGMLMMAFVLRVPSDVAQAYSNLLADLAASPIWLTGWTLTPLIMAAAAKFRGGSPMPRSGLEPWSGQGRIAARIEPMLPVVVTTIIAGFTMAEWWLTGSADGFGLTTTGLLMLLLVGRQGVIAGQAEMRRHAALIQAAADFAFVCDLTGRLVLTNPAMKGAIDLGDPREGPTYLQDLMPEATADLALERAIAGGWSGEVVIQGRAGRLPVALSLRPLVDERQTEPMVAGTAHDLTELK
jgi:PAS domain-containing protein